MLIIRAEGPTLPGYWTGKTFATVYEKAKRIHDNVFDLGEWRRAYKTAKAQGYVRIRIREVK